MKSQTTEVISHTRTLKKLGLSSGELASCPWLRLLVVSQHLIFSSALLSLPIVPQLLLPIALRLLLPIAPLLLLPITPRLLLPIALRLLLPIVPQLLQPIVP
jgi:hypothetical protein